ncbi:MAG: C-terminal helicase domain-containing protein, partial [Chloroflexi bacterium]|nr:C-terminal helicase domain-containing protein [Chloroflexota bacterium]
EMGEDKESLPDIDHVVYEVQSDDKFDVLQRLLDEPTEGGTLIFGRTKHGVRRMGQRLERSGYRLGVLHGNLSQPQRDRVLRDFRSGKVPVLLATNVAARGLDVLHIERVINYDLPETHDLFTHRVGRTGRMGRAGVAITLLSPVDLVKWNKLERGLGRKLPRMTLDGEPIATPAQSNGTKNGAKRGRRRNGWRSTQRPRQPQHASRNAQASPQRNRLRATPRLRT